LPFQVAASLPIDVLLEFMETLGFAISFETFHPAVK